MKKFRLVLLSCLLIVLCAAGCGKKATEIDPSEYITITFSGYDGFGKFESKEFDAAQLRDDFEKQLGDVSKSKLSKLLGEAITVKLSKDGSYSNGDKVSVEWDVDEDKLAELEKEYKVSFKLEDFEYTISGLTAVEKFNPFDGLVIKSEGISGSGTIYFDSKPYSELNYYFVDDNGNTYNKLSGVSNGDKIKVILYTSNKDANDYCLNVIQKVPTQTTMEYTVTGLNEYVEKLSDIPSSLTDKIKAEVVAKLKEQAAGWEMPDSLCEITYMGDAIQVYTNNSYYNDKNHYIVVYKVDVDNYRDGTFSYYFTGYYGNVLKNSNGDFTYNELVTPTVTTGWWVSGIYFKHGSLYYAGYEDYSKVEEAFFNDSNFKNELNIDKTIIEKQTHTAKDYSTIDGTVTLETADVCFSRIDGYNTIVGFTQSGYDKIMAYTSSQQIKLLLPTKDKDGFDVDDVHFYAKAVDSTQGFNFNTLVESDGCPRLYIVLPETCARFSGFRDSSIDEKGLYKVTGIDFNEKLTVLGEYALDSIYGIKKLTIPANVTIIPYRCFHEIRNLESVTFLGSIVKFESYAFQKCNKLVIDELVLDSQVIEGDAFEGVTINKLVLSSDNYHADYDYDRDEWEGANVVSLVINPGVTVINSYAFKYLSTVKEIVFPDSLVEIKYGAFRNCSALEKVTFPAKLPKFGEYAFYNCKNLVIDSLVLTEDLDLSSECLSGVTINTVTLASDNFATKKTWWAKNCLYGCNAKNFVIADTVTKIPSYLFSGMKFANSIEIPANVTTIEENAFYNYNDLIKLVCGASVTSIDDNLSLNSNVTVYAPKGSAMITYCINKGIRYVETE